MKTRLEEIDTLLTLLIKDFVCEYNLNDEIMKKIYKFVNLEIEKHDIMKG